ncbi:hypothetical protein [Klebsiella pneumoniae]|uniref:hypothetical protein n=1 Tax=Klebsiella pneumoniae TaxID=573 RepID=UPI0003D83F59|nr:hypothetical protein [Klebsiella pneumoniae]AHE43284.1 hypothetical protein KP13_00921 [Klebsiella pneumoniae subsp. pneumoniae Kp13]
MHELDDMFSNRPIVAQLISDAQEMVIQTDDGDGNHLTHDEQIEIARESSQ